MNAYIADALQIGKHAWAVRMCGSYHPDAHCSAQGMVSDQFVASYALSQDAWVAYCKPGGTHVEVPHSAGPAIAGAGGCNQYTVPLYAPIAQVPIDGLLFVVDEDHDWGEALVHPVTLHYSVSPLVNPQTFRPGAGDLVSVVLIAACVFYAVLHALWSLLPASWRRPWKGGPPPGRVRTAVPVRK